MKYCLEFGKKKGFHVENVILPSLKSAAQLAASLVGTFENDSFANGARATAWFIPSSGYARLTWESESHFVALSKLDGIDRGPASASLWRKGPAFMLRELIRHE